jgi:hypothetical protein
MLNRFSLVFRRAPSSDVRKTRNVAETAVGRQIIKRSPTRSSTPTRNAFLTVPVVRERALFLKESLPQFFGAVPKEKKL